jgi:hypothetical protein
MSIVTVPPDKIFIQSGAQIQELVKLTKELMSEAYLFTRKQIKKKKKTEDELIAVNSHS